jgi:hypothetical protein
MAAPFGHAALPLSRKSEWGSFGELRASAYGNPNTATIDDGW